VPSAGGEASTLVAGWARDFWIEDDRLLYVTAGFDLLSMPIEGGATQTIAYGTSLQASGDSYVATWALDRQAIYWVRDRYLGDLVSEHTIWRGDRSSGQETSVALPTKKDSGQVRDIIPVGDELLVTQGSYGSVAWAMPRTSGPPRQLASYGQDGRFLGVSRAGEILWARYEGAFDGTMGSDRYSVARADLSGSAPTPFWVDKPPNAYPMGAWERGGGGWYLSAWEWGKDDALHTALWTVDAAGKGTRISCDPEVRSRIQSATVTPEGFYAIVSYTNQYIQIVAVPAP
jgi:hypothetical protein